MIVVVSGSAVGIGRGVAETFASNGGTVIAMDVNTTENAVTKSRVEAAGGHCLTFDCDVADRLAVKEVFKSLPKELSRIDLLVNNAALWNDTSLTTGDYDQQTQAFDAAMGACAMSPFYCIAAALPFLKNSESANVINIITDHVNEVRYLSGVNATGYDCAKFSLWRLTEHWALELAPFGIRVNGLCFGATDTPMLRTASPEHVDRAMLVNDITDAITLVLNQGPNGQTGERFCFGMGHMQRKDSLKQIAENANAR